MKRSYFAGANTINGFVSYYEQIFGDIERIYVIKGGSGTGKSRLMKDVADAAENKGRCVEYFYCSFDPASLDGIIIDGSLAMIDGTSPHVFEPKLVGIKENLIDLGAFWDEEKLRESGCEIRELLRAKKEHFKIAYSYLSAVGALDTVKKNIADKYITRDKILTNAASLLSGSKPSQKGKETVRLVSSFGMDGRVSFNTFESVAQTTYKIRDSFGLGFLFLSALKNEAERFGISVVVSYDPLFENRPDALLLGDSIAVGLSPDGGDQSFSSFENALPENEKNELAELICQSKKLEFKAAEYLKKASKIHFNIENIFIPAMDFEKKEAFTRNFIKMHI